MEDLIASLTAMPFDRFKAEVSSISIDTLIKLKYHLDDLYYNSGNSTLQDHKYDVLNNFVKIATALDNKVGHPVRQEQNKVTLPYWLGSMDKIYPEDTEHFASWTGRNTAPSYCITEKLDGVSCLLVVRDNVTKLFTRGDGHVGTDISRLRSHIKGIPVLTGRNIAVRGELIVSRPDFAQLYADKFANARNMVSGIVNAKTIKDAIASLQFVAYEIISDETKSAPLSDQLSMLRGLQFKTTMYSLIDAPDLGMDTLRTVLLEYKSVSEFEIDGLVVHSNTPYVRNMDGNPKYAFAFKMVMEGATTETEVLGVEWNVSKRGLLKPRAVLAPVHLSGVTITHATAFNAKFVSDNKLGPGAVIQLTRSGEVIPYIVKVIKQAPYASMPPEGSWDWNETHVDIMSIGDNDDVRIKVIANFFAEIGVKHVSDATVTKLFEAGYDTIQKIVAAKSHNLEFIEGIKQKSAERIITNIREALEKVKLHQLMAASGLFGSGMGMKKTQSLLAQMPDLLDNMDHDKLVTSISKLDGFSIKTAPAIATGVAKFRKFVKELDVHVDQSILQNESRTPAAASNSFLSDMKVVLTGFRDKEIEEYIQQQGGTVQAGVSKTTTLVVAANPFETSSKIAKARQLNVRVVSKEEFMKHLSQKTVQ